MNKKRLLLVGAGRWGKIFLRNLQENPRLELAGIVTSQKRSAFPILKAEVELFPDFDHAMGRNWDGVILATPPDLHALQLETCLTKRIPTLVEKPLCLDLKTSLRLKEQADKTQTPVLVDHILLFHPGYEWLKENIAPDSPSIVRISSEGGNMGPFRPGYSPLWDYGSHDLSMVLDFINEPPTRISCTAEEQGHCEGGLAGTYRVSMEFAKGIHSEFRVSNRSEAKIRNFCVETKLETFLLEDHPAPRLLRTNKSTGACAEISLANRKPLERLLELFADGLEGRRDQRWGLGLGVKVVQALSACEAQISGKTQA